jgi:hypothetical protein
MFDAFGKLIQETVPGVRGGDSCDWEMREIGLGILRATARRNRRGAAAEEINFGNGIGEIPVQRRQRHCKPGRHSA